MRLDLLNFLFAVARGCFRSSNFPGKEQSQKIEIWRDDGGERREWVGDCTRECATRRKTVASRGYWDFLFFVDDFLFFRVPVRAEERRFDRAPDTLRTLKCFGRKYQRSVFPAELPSFTGFPLDNPELR